MLALAGVSSQRGRETPELALLPAGVLSILRAVFPLSAFPPQPFEKLRPMESFKVVYRAAVMIGTLIVGALAYRVYGPQLEKLAPVLSRAKQVIADSISPSEAKGEEDSPLPAAPMDPLTPSQPAGFIADEEPQPIHAPPLVDPAVKTVGGESAVPLGPQSPGSNRSPVAMVVDELKSRGIQRYSFTPWGNNGEYYRFHCAAPLAGGSGFTRHFEAVSADPAEAAQEVLRQINEWQMASAAQPQYR